MQTIHSTRTEAEVRETGGSVARTPETSGVRVGDPAVVLTSDGARLVGSVSEVHLDGLHCLMSAHVHVSLA